MRLHDLLARFTQVMPLATGIYTGLYYLCPNDPRRKRAHSVLFDAPIIPREYVEGPLDYDWETQIGAALAQCAEWRAQPKWTRRGETLEALTLTPSIARPCCHINITNGNVTS